MALRFFASLRMTGNGEFVEKQSWGISRLKKNLLIVNEIFVIILFRKNLVSEPQRELWRNKCPRIMIQPTKRFMNVCFTVGISLLKHK